MRAAIGVLPLAVLLLLLGLDAQHVVQVLPPADVVLRQHPGTSRSPAGPGDSGTTAAARCTGGSDTTMRRSVDSYTGRLACPSCPPRYDEVIASAEGTFHGAEAHR